MPANLVSPRASSAPLQCCHCVTVHPFVRRDVTETQVHPSWFAAVRMQVFGLCYACHFVHKPHGLSATITTGLDLSVKLRAISKKCCTACPAHIPKLTSPSSHPQAHVPKLTSPSSRMGPQAKLTGRLLMSLACTAPWHAQSHGMH